MSDSNNGRAVFHCSGTLPAEYLQDLLNLIRDFEQHSPEQIHLNIWVEALSASTDEMKTVLESLTPGFKHVAVHERFACEHCKGIDFLEGPHVGSAVAFCCQTCMARYNWAIDIGIKRYGFVAPQNLHLFHKTGWYPVRRDRA